MAGSAEGVRSQDGLDEHLRIPLAHLAGTTGAAAVLEDRRFLGIELEPAYIEIATARIAHHSPKGTRKPKVCRAPLGRRR